MSCDIYVCTEILGNNNKWECADLFLRKNNSASKRDEFERVSLCERRDYNLFAILANVRNESNVNYISSPKGIPKDSCKQTVDRYTEHFGDLHNPSYITLKEAIDFFIEEQPAAGFSALCDLIKILKERLAMFGMVSSYRWDLNYDRAYAISDRIRIVFWFDS